MTVQHYFSDLQEKEKRSDYQAKLSESASQWQATQDLWILFKTN